MLTCPHCQKPLAEDAPSCPSCSLSLEGVTALLGPVPLLNRGLADTTDTLSRKQQKSIQSAITQFERTFPHSHLNIVVRELDPQFKLSTHLFWLFNTAGLSSSDSQFEKNQDLLLILDPATQRLGLMVGYGLEPFLSSEAITEFLASARPSLEAGQPAEALLGLARLLPRFLTKASAAARQSLGL